MATLLKESQVILKNGKPSAVIIDFKKFLNLLDLIEDREDMKELEKLRKRSLKFRKFEDFLKGYSSNV